MHVQVNGTEVKIVHGYCFVAMFTLWSVGAETILVNVFIVFAYKRNVTIFIANFHT